MAPKRKSDTQEQPEIAVLADSSIPNQVSAEAGPSTSVPAAKKALVEKNDASGKPTKWQDVVLDGEDDEITPWLREIGNINSNSYQRFMKATGPTGGAENGTYVAAYKYFEKVRILGGKKKTPKRIRNEQENPDGFSLTDRRRTWVFMPRY